MRPVNRGPAPRTYATYGDAIDDLEARMGPYCSYCERRLPTSLAVEHVVPKSLVPALEKTWNNFLLACTNCNSVKSNQPTSKMGSLWPDLDNTLRAFTYDAAGTVQITTTATTGVKKKARALQEMVGLERHPANRTAAKPAPRDRRWLQREETWALASRYAKALPQQDSPLLRDAIVDLALAKGFFSVWFTVFAKDADMRLRLVAAFTGSAANCFDAKGKPVARPGGRC